jgi:flagellar biosynthesis GTPase FlhF
MITRTIRAENMLTALEVIKKELGPDALVVSVRQIMSGPSWQVWRKPLVEVVAVRLVEGEPPEQLRAVMNQHQVQSDENSVEMTVDALEHAVEKGETHFPILSQPDEPVSPENLLETQKTQSFFARRYQKPSEPATEDEDDLPFSVPQELKQKPQSLARMQAPVEASLKPLAQTPVQEQPKVQTQAEPEMLQPENQTQSQLQAPPQLAAAKPEQQPRRKRDVSKPVFERISTGIQKKGIGPESVDDYSERSYPPPYLGEGASRSELPATFDFPPMVLKTYQYLVRHGLDDGLVKHAARICMDTLSPHSIQEKASVWSCMQRQLQSSIRVEEENINTMSRVIFLVGTSGSGKTSTLAKLSVHLSANFGRKVGWVCADTVRIGSLAESRTYAETIGVPLQVAYTSEELQQAINSLLNEVEFILVDTPAYNPRSEQSVAELGELLTAYPRRCTWIVTPATAKESDLQNTLASVGPFKPRGLLVSKLDETNNFSAVFNIAWRSQLPFTYFTLGSRIVNDLMPARADLLVRAIFDERFTP